MKVRFEKNRCEFKIDHQYENHDYIEWNSTLKRRQHQWFNSIDKESKLSLKFKIQVISRVKAKQVREATWCNAWSQSNGKQNAYRSSSVQLNQGYFRERTWCPITTPNSRTSRYIKAWSYSKRKYRNGIKKRISKGTQKGPWLGGEEFPLAFNQKFTYHGF